MRQHPRWGCRRISVLLRREGWHVNRKRVYQLWRKEGLKVPRRQRKKRRLGHSFLDGVSLDGTWHLPEAVENFVSWLEEGRRRLR